MPDAIILFPTRLCVRLAKTQISRQIPAICTASSQGTMLVEKDSEDSDHAARKQWLVNLPWAHVQSCKKCCAPAHILACCLTA